MVQTDAAPGQSREWTVIDFEAGEEADRSLARSLAGVFLTEGAGTPTTEPATETVVVFAGRQFRYPPGDAAGREQAAAHGRSVGVPEPQLDWTE